MKSLVFFPLLIILLGVVFYFFPRHLVINSIECKSQFGLCAKNISESLGILEGLTYSEFEDNVSTLLSKNNIDSFAYRLKLPRSIVLDIIEKKPYYSILDGKGRYAMIDRGGKVLTNEDTTPLPYIISEGLDLSPGDFLPDDVLFALGLLNDLHKSFEVRNGRLTENSMVIQLDKMEIIFPLMGDRKVLAGGIIALITRLEGVENENEIENDICENGCIIDMRFENPVIRIK